MKLSEFFRNSLKQMVINTPPSLSLSVSKFFILPLLALFILLPMVMTACTQEEDVAPQSEPTRLTDPDSAASTGSGFTLTLDTAWAGDTVIYF